MEPAAPGTEDDNIQPTLSKKASDDERLLSIKGQLPSGRYGNVFSKSYNDGMEQWYCNICECPVMGRMFHHETGKRHTQMLGKMDQRWSKDRYGKDAKIEDEKPEVKEEEDLFGKMGSGMDQAKIEVAPGEPVPPGVDGESTKVAQIQDRLDKFKASALLGLEYLLEITDYDVSREPSYLCALCDKKGDPRTVIAHLVSYNHLQQFMQRHFPATYRALSPFITRQYRKNWQDTMNSIAEAIEAKYGRLLPHPVDKDTFEKKKDFYYQMIHHGPHFSEKNGITFENMVKADEITKNIEEDPTSTTETTPSGKKRSPSPPVVAKPTATKRMRSNPDHIRGRRDSLSSVSSVSSNELDEDRGAGGAATRERPYRGRGGARGGATRRGAGRLSKSMSISPERNNGAGRNNNSRSRSRSRSRYQNSHNPRYHNSTNNYRGGQSSYRGMNNPRYNNSNNNRRSRSRSPRKVINRSRSRSPRRLPWERSNYTNRAVGSNRSPPPPKVDITARLERAKTERETKLEEYNRLSKAIENDMSRVLKAHEKNPEKHKDYNEEWKLFWNKRYKELQVEGKDAANYDFKPEWIIVWNKRMMELHNNEVTIKKEALRRRLGLREEPTPISFRIGKHSPTKGPAPVAAQPDQDHEVIVIDDKEDDAPLAVNPMPPAGRTPPAVRPETRGSPVRSHSPWETDVPTAVQPKRTISVERKSVDVVTKETEKSAGAPRQTRDEPNNRNASRSRRSPSPDYAARRTDSTRDRSIDRERKRSPVNNRDKDTRVGSLPGRDRERVMGPDRRDSRDKDRDRVIVVPDRRNSRDRDRAMGPDRRDTDRDRGPDRRDSRDRGTGGSDRRDSRDKDRDRRYDSRDRDRMDGRRSRGEGEPSWERDRRGRSPRSRSPLPVDREDRDRYYRDHPRSTPDYFVRERSWERVINNHREMRMVPQLHGVPPMPEAYRPPMIMRDVTSVPMHYVGSMPMAMPMQQRPKSPEIEIPDDEVTIVSVLRLLTALEDTLGSLGPKVTEMLATALALEKNEPNSCETMMDNEINCVLFETVKEKLKGRLQAGLVTYKQEKAVKFAIKGLASLVHQGSERKRIRQQQAALNPLTVPGVGVVDKAAIAKQIATALVLQGKTDVTQGELEQLINAVVGMAEASKHSDTPISTASFLTKCREKTPEFTPKIIIPTVIKEQERIKAEQEAAAKQDALRAEEKAAAAAAAAASKPDEETSAMEGLSDSDLQTLLQNFKDLSTEEQHGLISYLKKLEAREPQRVEKLRQFVNMGKPEANEDLDKSKPDHELDEYEIKKSKDKEEALKSEQASKIKFDSDEEDYSYEDVFKVAKQNVTKKEKEAKEEKARKKAALEEEEKKNLEINLDQAKLIIANLMGTISKAAEAQAAQAAQSAADLNSKAAATNLLGLITSTANAINDAKQQKDPVIVGPTVGPTIEPPAPTITAPVPEPSPRANVVVPEPPPTPVTTSVGPSSDSQESRLNFEPPPQESPQFDNRSLFDAGNRDLKMNQSVMNLMSTVNSSVDSDIRLNQTTSNNNTQMVGMNQNMGGGTQSRFEFRPQMAPVGGVMGQKIPPPPPRPPFQGANPFGMISYPTQNLARSFGGIGNGGGGSNVDMRFAGFNNDPQMSGFNPFEDSVPRPEFNRNNMNSMNNMNNMNNLNQPQQNQQQQLQQQQQQRGGYNNNNSNRW